MKETRKGCVLFPARSTPPRVSFLKLEAVPAEPQACGPGPREDAGQGCGRTRVRSPSTGLSHCTATATVGIVL